MQEEKVGVSVHGCKWPIAALKVNVATKQACVCVCVWRRVTFFLDDLIYLSATVLKIWILQKIQKIKIQMND